MFTKKRFVLLIPIVVCLFSSKGQEALLRKIDSYKVSMNRILIKDVRITHLLDSVIVCWNSPPLSRTYSYATMTPHVTYDDQVVWNVRIEQLHDYESFSMLLADNPEFARNSVSYGVIQYDTLPFYVGVEKDSDRELPEKKSLAIVETFFCPDTTVISYNKDSIEKKIATSEYIHHIDSTGGTDNMYDWELFVDDLYDVLILDFMEVFDEYICIRKEIKQIP